MPSKRTTEETYAKIAPASRVEILKGSDTGYFKPGQRAYAIAWDARGGYHRVDGSGVSKKGEVSYLVSKTREMKGGALWFAPKSIRFTGRG